MSKASERARDLLLVEPQFLFRRTVAAVARDLRLATIHEATTLAAAERLMATTSFDALILSLDEKAHALELLERVRAGTTPCAASIPTILMADACDAGLALSLRQLQVRRLLLKPFKIRSVIECIAGLWPAAATADS